MPPNPAKKIAALGFRPDADIRRMTEDERADQVDEIVTEAWTAAKIAIDIIAMTKPELVKAVGTDVEQYGPHLQWFAHAKEAAGILRAILAAAEKRLAIALANVEEDDTTTSH